MNKSRRSKVEERGQGSGLRRVCWSSRFSVCSGSSLKAELQPASVAYHLLSVTCHIL